MSEIKIFHNPRCSKSRAALSLLEERGIAAEVVKYLDTPPDLSELKDIFNKLGLASARGMMRVKDDLYKELGLDNDALLRAIADHPALLERPIVLANGKAAVGRPLENIEAVL
ncbi:arsenate reductase [Neisseria meningitidis]|uniref:arsenate reductase (glutaredoxin) n=1 Tax=Neisseria meningitidis TaxID=487 RepID=UPI000766A330|nr:arsenate reductase (glutaredoxin) [Neisseria meningitidis]CWM64794.1 arsenate reductase [Neisseria meningitidis]CWQ66118.1 arsenate reductase [Neisseria meningitidis]